MVDACAAKGFQAVEFDNLDSWTRFDGTDLEGQVPFGRDEAVAYAVRRQGAPRLPAPAADAVHGKLQLRPAEGDTADQDERMVSDADLEQAKQESNTA
jgi:hypothetical protein